MHTETLQVNGKPDEQVKLRIKLQPHLQHPAENLGHVWRLYSVPARYVPIYAIGQVVVVVYPTRAAWEQFFKQANTRYEEVPSLCDATCYLLLLTCRPELCCGRGWPLRNWA